ncbi:MAG: Ig-like domain-containing protein [Candidatus Margulisiibacteriota bacterium]
MEKIKMISGLLDRWTSGPGKNCQTVKRSSGLAVLLSCAVILFSGFAYAAPVISNEEVSTLTDTTVIITWTTTNELSDTKVYCGISYPNPTTPKYSSAESTYYHYATLTNLSPGTAYKYYITSGTASTATAIKTFTTLTPPSGTYLFSFASMNDFQYGDGKVDTTGARGRPYSHSVQIMDAMISEINKYSPDFTVIKGDLIETSIASGDSYFPYGDDVFNVEAAPKYAGQESLRIKLNRLNSPYYPIPGNHDKASLYFPGTNWVSANLGALYPPMAGTNPNIDSDFNYSFINSGYRFIMLDSMRKSDQKASVEATYLNGQLAAAQAAGQKCFIFLHHPVTNVRSEGIPDDVIKEITGSTEADYSKVQIINTAEVQSLISDYKNIIAGVFSGHIHDNKYLEIAGVPCVRTSSGLQFPATFNVYKVYSNGFIQSTYKVPSWTEIARNTVTDDFGESGIHWQQFSLGPNSARNFSHTIANLPPEVAATNPLNGATSVPLNEMIRIVFSKSMSAADTQNAFTITPDISGKTFSWENNNTIMAVAGNGLTAGTAYTGQIGTGAKDSTGTAIASSYSFNFTAGTSSNTTAPAAAFDHFSNDLSIDNQPTFTGIATDQASAIVSIECRVDGGSWSAASPLDGLFNSKTESFLWPCSQVLTRGITSHEVEVKCRDAAGNINSTYASYSFYIIGDRPEIDLQSRGTTIINGDTVDKDPSFAVTVISNALPVSAQSKLQKSTDAQPVVLALTLTADPNNPNILHGTYSPSLTDGKYDIKIEAIDSNLAMTTKEVTNLIVQLNADLAVQGAPLNYPNPFNPEITSTTIAYTLSKPGNITLSFHDLMGNQIARKSYSSGAEGGKAGYNEILWNGRSDGGNLLGNGIYTYLVVGDGKVLARGKATVLK